MDHPCMRAAQSHPLSGLHWPQNGISDDLIHLVFHAKHRSECAGVLSTCPISVFKALLGTVRFYFRFQQWLGGLCGGLEGAQGLSCLQSGVSMTQALCLSHGVTSEHWKLSPLGPLRAGVWRGSECQGAAQEIHVGALGDGLAEIV